MVSMKGTMIKPVEADMSVIYFRSSTPLTPAAPPAHHDEEKPHRYFLWVIL